MSEAKQTSIEQGDTLGPSLFTQGLNVVFSRELSAYFDSPIAYIYAAVFLVLSCTTFMNSFFLEAVVDMSAYFDVLPFLLIPFIPAITMRTWAEEHAQHTFEMLMTLPLHPAQIVLGKYAAALAFYATVLVSRQPTHRHYAHFSRRARLGHDRGLLFRRTAARRIFPLFWSLCIGTHARPNRGFCTGNAYRFCLCPIRP